MSNYEDLAPFYDELFGLGGEQIDFIMRQAAGATSIADLGCGTGRHLALFARSGAKLAGVDPEESMIRKARELLGPEAQLVCCGMEEADRDLDGDRDLILCLGNSLSHLTTPADLARTMAAVAALLRPGGTFLAQTVHFEKVLRLAKSPFEDRRITTPTGENLTFSRRYLFDRLPELLDFEVRLTRGDEELVCDRIPLRPITLEELELALGSAGLELEKVWGDWTGRERDSEAPATIVRARL